MVITDELAVGPLDWLVESDEGEKLVVTGSLAVGVLDLWVDKSVFGHNSAAGKETPHAAQRAGLVALGNLVVIKTRQHPMVELRLFRAVWQEWVHPCAKFCWHWDSTAYRYDVTFGLLSSNTRHSSSLSVVMHA